MDNVEFKLRGVSDPRLAVHAASQLPVLLWSADGTRILWANPVGARLFGAASAAALAARTFGPADVHRRQVAHLAGRLLPSGAARLERLRGFGASLGTLATCACARLDFPDGGAGILVVAMLSPGELRRIDAVPPNASVGPPQRPVADRSCAAVAEPAAEAVEAAGHFRAEPLPESAEHAEIAPTPQPDLAAMDQPTPDDEEPAATGEAPSEFALIDAVEPAPEPAADHLAAAETPPPVGSHDDEPSAFIEAVADEPSAAGAVEAPANQARPVVASPTEPPPRLQTIDPRPPDAIAAPSWVDGPHPRRHPLRFVWQMDAEGRFLLGSDEFTRLIGARTASSFGRHWDEIAEVFGLDPEGRVAHAVATRDTWSGIALNWPVDGGEHLRVELSGLPMFGRARNFVGYRGFGVCRDVDGLERLDALRRTEFFSDPPAPLPLSADAVQADPAAEAPAADSSAPSEPPGGVAELPASIAPETSRQTDLENQVDNQLESPRNVLPFRQMNEPKSPALTPVENNAFDELARQLTARLENESPEKPFSDPLEAVVEQPRVPERSEPAGEHPDWLSRPEPAPRGETARDRILLDLLPTGVLIYRLDRLLYANPAFLASVGYGSLAALEEAGGLDALLVEPGVSSASSTSDTGTSVTISATQASAGHAPPSATGARLFTISWDGEAAHALICGSTRVEPEAAAAPAPSAVGHANAEELGAILDTTADGIVMFDGEGNLNSCNRSAEALFGYDGDDLVRRNLAELFAPESRRVVKDYLESIRNDGLASLLDHGREVLGRVREGGLIALSMTMGRTQPHSPNFFAVFRDLSQTKRSEAELLQARRAADRSVNAKADVLAWISHEVRTPLNAIIGFSEVMIDERFGALGNERYVEYMKDIRASGERVIAIINDLNDLSRIETGKLDLAFVNQNLNDLIEQCVAAMQPQANRERIIIRTSLAHTLPPVVADAGALRQIALNLIGNSIHFAKAGGQVIVSTALSDFGEVVLRVRDTGFGLHDEVAAAIEPFRTQAPADQSSGSGVSLSLTKALVEANRAQFQIKTGGHSGTLIEVTFGPTMARA
ncbi:PAS domain S-box protein [uncultured Bradyrhizobium sp.]|uniref:PAS domain S-box protein n=1 Tax=uncultured Bradyrhizobium sp. TaxID=199684 RepID=UPI0035CA6BBC